MAKRSSHSWRFFGAGGVDQVVLAEGRDLEHLDELDQKLWVALACPTKGTEIDERTLSLIDTDGDGRVRVPEILGAVAWVRGVLKRLDLLFEPGDAIPLAEIDGKDPDGKRVLASAKRILADQDKGALREVSLADVEAMEAVFVAKRLNGDGVVPADSAEDEATRAAIEQVIGAVGSVPDRSGKPGVSRALLDAFFEQATAAVAWDDEGRDEAIRPLGDATAAAALALDAVAGKVDDYFARCRIATYDPRAAVALGPSEADLQALASRSLSASDAELAKLPLAQIEGGKPLPLASGLNPAWAARVDALAREAVAPLLGTRTSLSEADYALLVGKLEAFRAWQGRAPTGAVAALGVDRLRELVTAEQHQKIAALIAEDAALEGEYAQISAVEKAVRLRRDLVTVLRNFVNFADFYGRGRAVFQAGTLYLDGRACDLVVTVNDPAKHASLAGLSRAYLAYCDCTRGAEKIAVVAAFTAGDVDNLMVGRNGIFYDRKGRDWDARIVSLVENPISIQQAFWAPYKRLVRLVEEQVAKRAAEKDKASAAKVETAAVAVGSADQAPSPGAPAAPGSAAAAPPKKLDVGIVAAVGVAVAGVATFLSSALGMLLGLGFWAPLGIVGLMLAISAPSTLIAWLKLRQRNLGPLLDASGWAINGLVKVNVPFGGSLTTVAALPPGTSRAVVDPFAERPSRWGWWAALAVLALLGLAWATGRLDAVLPAVARSTSVLPPAAVPAPPGVPSASAPK